MQQTSGLGKDVIYVIWSWKNGWSLSLHCLMLCLFPALPSEWSHDQCMAVDQTREWMRMAHFNVSIVLHIFGCFKEGLLKEALDYRKCIRDWYQHGPDFANVGSIGSRDSEGSSRFSSGHGISIAVLGVEGRTLRGRGRDGWHRQVPGARCLVHFCPSNDFKDWISASNTVRGKHIRDSRKNMNTQTHKTSRCCRKRGRGTKYKYQAPGGMEGYSNHF